MDLFQQFAQACRQIERIEKFVEDQHILINALRATVEQRDRYIRELEHDIEGFRELLQDHDWDDNSIVWFLLEHRKKLCP